MAVAATSHHMWRQRPSWYVDLPGQASKNMSVICYSEHYVDFLQAGKTSRPINIQLPGGVEFPIKIRSFSVRFIHFCEAMSEEKQASLIHMDFFTSSRWQQTCLHSSVKTWTSWRSMKSMSFPSSSKDIKVNLSESFWFLVRRGHVYGERPSVLVSEFTVHIPQFQSTCDLFYSTR